MFNIIRYLLQLVQIDQAVAYSILGNISSLLIGGVSVYLIANYFSLEAQGYYYAFAGFVSFQFILELGLGQTVIPFASHEWVHLGFSKEGQITGNLASQARLLGLGRLLFKWYSASAGIVILGLIPMGYFFFSHSASSQVEWTYPWIVLCIFIALNLAVMPIFNLMQGCNEVSLYGYYRFIQQFAYGIPIWVTTLFGGELWALPAAAASILAWSCFFIWTYQRKFLFFFVNSKFIKVANCWREIWPIQWRTAISWASSNFIPLLFAPILFHISGSALAGQMGMTVTINNILLALSSSWIVTKLPRFGLLLATKEYKSADFLFLKSLSLSFFIISFGAIAIWLLIYSLYSYDHSLKTRVLPPLSFALFLLGSIVHSISNNISVYLKAHKKDPLAFPYLFCAILIIVMAIILGSYLEALGVIIAYLTVVLLIQLPLSLRIYFRNHIQRNIDI